MRIPEVTGRVRRGPGQALRAVFTGIGQMFVATDRLKEQVESSAEGGPGDGPTGWGAGSDSGTASRAGASRAGAGRTGAGRTGVGGPGAGAPRAGEEPAGRADRSRRSAGAGTAPPGRWRSLDSTGNVRLLSAEDLALEFPETPAPAAKPDVLRADSAARADATAAAGAAAAAGEVTGTGDTAGADEMPVTDEAIEAAPAPAPVESVRKAPPRTIIIVDQALSGYQADQATADQVPADEAATQEAATDRPATSQPATSMVTAGEPPKDRATIVFVDDSLLDSETDEASEAPADQAAHYDAIVAAGPDGADVDVDDAEVLTDTTDEIPPIFEVASYEAPAGDETALAAATAAEPAEPAEPTEPAEPAGGDADALPVPGYDSLSLPSLRARLRNLDIDQVRTLLDYERSHAARADMITMFERRIAKLAAAQ